MIPFKQAWETGDDFAPMYSKRTGGKKKKKREEKRTLKGFTERPRSAMWLLLATALASPPAAEPHAPRDFTVGLAQD